MPKKFEKELRKQARKKGLTGEDADSYVYGTLRKTGWKPKRENTSESMADRLIKKIDAYFL